MRIGKSVALVVLATVCLLAALVLLLALIIFLRVVLPVPVIARKLMDRRLSRGGQQDRLFCVETGNLQEIFPFRYR